MIQDAEHVHFNPISDLCPTWIIFYLYSCCHQNVNMEYSVNFLPYFVEKGNK